MTTIQEDALASALENAQTFPDNKQIGRILLLPSDICKKVLISFKEGSHYDASGKTLSISCVLKPKKRTINVAYYQYYSGVSGQNTLEIKNPHILYLFTTNLVQAHDYCEATKGYMFLYKRRKTLVESFKKAKHYFFPHIYHEGYMCVNATTAKASPRTLNSYFWTSNFHNDWFELYELSRAGAMDGHKLVGRHDYNEFQKSTSKTLTLQNRQFLTSFSHYFETDSKPSGVFVSHDPDVIKTVESININDVISWTNRYYGGTSKAIVGFTYINGGEYWVMLKSGAFLKLTSDQVKIA